MGDCTKSTKRIAGNVVVMEEEEEEQEAEASNASLLSKKSNFIINYQELNLPLTENDHNVVVSPPKTSSSSDSISVSDNCSSSRCSSDGFIKSADLINVTSFETEVSTCNIKFRISSNEETNPLSEICEDSEDQTSMDAPSKKPSSSEEEPEKIPSVAEIDEFFTAAEKHEQKRFAEKYNYDIVKDTPLEGRYQWVRFNEA